MAGRLCKGCGKSLSNDNERCWTCHMQEDGADR